MTEYKGLVAVITGANNGFGKEFVKQAAKREMKIVAVDIESDFDDLEKTAMELGKKIRNILLHNEGFVHFSYLHYKGFTLKSKGPLKKRAS